MSHKTTCRNLDDNTLVLLFMWFITRGCFVEDFLATSLDHFHFVGHKPPRMAKYTEFNCIALWKRTPTSDIISYVTCLVSSLPGCNPGFNRFLQLDQLGQVHLKHTQDNVYSNGQCLNIKPKQRLLLVMVYHSFK